MPERILYYKNRTTENLFAEMWYPIKNYSGLYEVSNYSRIKSLYDNFLRRRDFVLSQFTDKDGYLTVRLSKNGIAEQKRVHTIVGDVFCVNPFNKPIYNHEDGVKDNNLPYNLKPSTYSENTIHAYSIGLMKDCNAKLNRNQVMELFNSIEDINLLSHKYNISEAAIYALKLGKNWGAVTGKTWIRNAFKRPSKDAIIDIYTSKEKSVELAKKYGVTTCTVSEIRNNKTHTKITSMI